MNVFKDKYLRNKINWIISRQKKGKVVIAAYKDGSALPAREDCRTDIFELSTLV